MQRDFTYIDDVVRAVFKLTIKVQNSKSKIQEIFNIGRGKGVNLLKFIKCIEDILNIKSKKKFLPLQKSDMINAKSNINKINKLIKIRAGVNLKYGLTKFIE